MNKTKVFIKLCCREWDTIPAEVFLNRYSDFKRHPSIITYGVEPFSWIATEFVPSVPIDQLRGSIDIQELVKQMALILDEMNENGIIHRDLRPENICLDEEGNLIIIDFGWAIFRDNNWEKTPYEFIEKILNKQYRHETGEFDDALSAYLSFKSAFPSATEEDMKLIIDRIGRLTA